ncbi:M23 family metallopeptidase [Corynebacterium hylobatis]|uniref:M23 family metallopeptidase n=1 Tax=Corynebacterium hylobatis TaxID=1859290 RepID=A0A3S0BI76_9CORY|nr:M23 family metallopeptidase [Corynebacterium hylobatis]RSZ63932.1 M23 family metallopeptidase [Corynebacterium hylobatis]
MFTKPQRSTATERRTISNNRSARNRVAFIAAAAGVVSTAGIGGAAAATLQADSVAPSPILDYQLVNDSEHVLSPAMTTSPQILEIAEFKPVDNMEEQLAKSTQLAEERAAAEAEAAAIAAAEAAAQAEAEAAAAAEAEAAAAAEASAGVARPAEGVFTSGYGPRWGTLHAGIDIAAPIGTPIYAIMSGTVIDSGPASGYGQWIRIQHDDGSMSIYGHMSSLGVSVGQYVTAGQYIAGMGSEGFSTGSHLHFEIHPTGSGAVDPVPWFAQHGIYF